MLPKHTVFMIVKGRESLGECEWLTRRDISANMIVV